MKKMSQVTSTLAALLLAVCLAAPAQAGLLAKSPNFNLGGFPVWLQDQTSLALQGCLDGTLGPLGTDPPRCFLPDQDPLAPVEQPGFDPVAPKDANNWPGENMYYLSTTADMTLPTGQIASVEFAVEATVVTDGAALVPGSQLMFHRLRMIFLPNTTAGAGTYTVVHPWGTTVFTAGLQENPFGAGGARGRATADVNLALEADLPTPFAGILGNNPLFAMSTFPASVPTPPAINPPGFLGDCTSFLPITGGVAGVNNVQILGPDGALVAETNLFRVCAQKFGMDVTPASSEFGIWQLNAPSTPITFTVTNLTGLDIPARDAAADPPAGLILTPDNPMFSIPAATDTCADGVGVIPPDNTCTFDVVFTPTADGIASGSILIASAGDPNTAVSVTGTGDAIAPALAVTGISRFTQTATQTISGTVSDLNAVGGVNVSVDNAPAVPATVTAGTWTFDVPALGLNAAHTIAVTANDTALPAPGNVATVDPATTTITVDTLPPTVVVTSPVTLPPTAPTNVTTTALTFTANDNFNVASTIVKVDGGLPITAPPATLGPFADGLHTVDVVSTDSAGNITTVTNSFTIDATAPVITVTSPKPTNGRFGVISPILRFNVSDANPVPTSTIVTLDGIVVANAVSDVTPLGPFTAGESHTLTITTTDGAGNPSTTTTGAFTIVLADGRVVSLGAELPAITDALATLRHSVQLVVLDADQFAHADVAPLDVNGVPNPDGTVDIADALLILRRVVGLVTTF